MKDINKEDSKFVKEEQYPKLQDKRKAIVSIYGDSVTLEGLTEILGSLMDVGKVTDVKETANHEFTMKTTVPDLVNTILASWSGYSKVKITYEE